MADREILSGTRLIVLSLPSLAFAGYDLARRVFLAPYLSGELSLQVGVVGWLVLLANFASIPAELLAGSMGDHGSDRLGRRRLWMILGTALALIGTAGLLRQGTAPSITSVAVALVALVVGWALCNVTHGAWALEAAHDNRSRGRIFGTRTLFGIAGGICFSAIGALQVASWPSPFTVIMITVAFGALVLHATLVTLLPDQAPAPGRWRLASLLDPLWLLFASRGNRRLAALFALNGAHAAITTTGYFYMVDNGLGLHGWAPTGILVQTICAAIGILAAIRIGASLSAHALLRLTLWANLGLALALPLLPAGSPVALILWTVPFGLTSAIDFMALRMLLGARLDAGSSPSGKRAAAHYAGFHLPFNLCGAVASGLLFAGYRTLGFDPRAALGPEQTFAPVLLVPGAAAALITLVSLRILADSSLDEPAGISSAMRTTPEALTEQV
ncbi:MFS transporter [Sphingomonas sp. OTU376]|uniref:MFS transporter n=1 Tax=Sphingomonas sp. OTU376 TaxID=3043863 RepID=UPI00313C41E6